MVKCGEGCNRGELTRCWHPFHTRTKEAMTTDINCSSYKSVLVFYELDCIDGLYIGGQEISTDLLALGVPRGTVVTPGRWNHHTLASAL